MNKTMNLKKISNKDLFNPYNPKEAYFLSFWSHYLDLDLYLLPFNP